MRNALLLGLAEDQGVHLGRLAAAFGVTTEMLRVLRVVAREEGIEAALLRAPRGRSPLLSEPQRRKVEQQFEAGLGPKEARAAVKGRVSQRTVERMRTAWLARRAAASTAAATPRPPSEGASSSQLELAPRVEGEPPAASEAMVPPAIEGAETDVSPSSATHAEAPAGASPRAAVDEAPSAPAMREVNDDEQRNTSTEVRSARNVQHLGAWVAVAMVGRLGLFERAAKVAKERVAPSALRIALEALIVALAIGERCVEGVRRVQTRSAGVLLRSRWAPSATWTRRVLGRLSKELGGFLLHMSMAGGYVRGARSESGAPAVFYVDNHLRPYTGKEVIRKGWRMQAKRAVPGATDYYVHDEDGRPLFRYAVPENEGLTEWLPRIARTLRDVLEADESMVLAFDRAGAFAEHMAGLRNEKFSFVTYERKPYPKLPSSAFTERVSLDGEEIAYSEARINLGKGRGRLRRIAMQVADEGEAARQINLLAAGDAPAATLIAIMRGRWNQENGFKHGVERWGINQLDGRATKPYPEDAIIPNPARRRLERAVRAARGREGQARCALAQLPADSPKRARAERDLEDALSSQRDLEAQRPTTPDYAPVKETELAGELRRHLDEYKATIDAVRIACANAESDLAVRLAPHMKRPAEAKKLLANLFGAPGHVHARPDCIHVHLEPAATAEERQALDALLAEITALRPTLPGDARARPVRFTTQI